MNNWPSLFGLFPFYIFPHMTAFFPTNFRAPRLLYWARVAPQQYKYQIAYLSYFIEHLLLLTDTSIKLHSLVHPVVSHQHKYQARTSTTSSNMCSITTMHNFAASSSMCYLPPTRVPSCRSHLIHQAHAFDQHKYQVVHFSCLIKHMLSPTNSSIKLRTSTTSSSMCYLSPTQVPGCTTLLLLTSTYYVPPTNTIT